MHFLNILNNAVEILQKQNQVSGLRKHNFRCYGHMINLK